MPANRSEYNRAWYRKNRKKTIDRVQAGKRRIDAEVRAAKSKPCMDCGVSYPWYVMDFDHRDPSLKSFTLSMWKRSAMGARAVRREIEKCDVVCSNCHRERTYQAKLARSSTAEPPHDKREAVVQFHPCQPDMTSSSTGRI